MQFDPTDYRIMECVTGSRLYGLSTTDSDWDYRGVVIPPSEVLLDPFMKFEVKDGWEGEDRSLYDLGKFIKLCADMNPNIAELIFIPEDKYIYISDEWEYILSNRNLFLSKKAKFTFLGYSISQMQALERHRGWFIDPPKQKPRRKDFGLAETPLISEGSLQNALSLPVYLFKKEYIDELVREREYRDAKKKWDNYIQWQTHRNPKRKASEEKCGYDGKYASHVFRLMEEGRQLLLEGNITFPLHNADFLLAVKNGEYSYEQILEMASGMEQNFDKWYEESTLPNRPNINAIKELYYEVIKR